MNVPYSLVALFFCKQNGIILYPFTKGQSVLLVNYYAQKMLAFVIFVTDIIRVCLLIVFHDIFDIKEKLGLNGT